MLVYEMIEQTQSKLKKTQITTVSAMNDLDPVILFGNHAQINDPDISQASGNEQAGQTHWVGDMTFVQVETTAFLVREESFDSVSSGVPVTSFFSQFHIGDQVDWLFTANFPPSDGQHRIIILDSLPDTFGQDTDEHGFHGFFLDISRA